MSRKWSVAYSVLAIVVLLATASYVLLAMDNTREEALTRAIGDLARVAERLAEADTNRDIQSSTASFVRNNPRIRALLVRLEGETIYLYAAESGYLSGSASNLQSVHSLTSASLLEGVVETDADDAPYLQAVYSLVDRRTIFLLLRDALFIVLGFALVTTGILLTLALGGSRSKSRAGRSGPSTAAWPMPGTDDPLETAEQSGESGGVSEPPSPFEAAPEAAPSSEPALEARRESGPAAQAEPEPAPSSEPAPAPEGLSASEAERGDEAPEHVPELERVEGLDEGSEPADTGGPRGAREADGLFSARTGLSYRSHLDHRLQQEVERAAYNEEDVCVALLSFPGLMATDEDYRKIAQGMLDTFRFPELLFEFTDDTFCVILPNTDLDHGIRRVGDFAKDYPQLASHTGLSSRNGRLVEGKRLLMEAERARQKAEAEGELIIGFRPDPDRYRSYLTSAD